MRVTDNNFTRQMKKIAALTLATSLVMGMSSDYSTLIFNQDPCGKHKTLKDGYCACKKGYVRDGPDCKRCPDHAFYDCTHNKCKCEPSYDWDSANFMCKKKPM